MGGVERMKGERRTVALPVPRLVLGLFVFDVFGRSSAVKGGPARPRWAYFARAPSWRRPTSVRGSDYAITKSSKIKTNELRARRDIGTLRSSGARLLAGRDRPRTWGAPFREMAALYADATRTRASSRTRTAVLRGWSSRAPIHRRNAQQRGAAAAALRPRRRLATMLQVASTQSSRRRRPSTSSIVRQPRLPVNANGHLTTRGRRSAAQ